MNDLAGIGQIVAEVEHNRQVPPRRTKTSSDHKRKSKRSSRHSSGRVAPVDMNTIGNATRRKSNRRKPKLKIDTKSPYSKDDNDASTPATAASTPPSTPGVRTSGDLRSPGADKTPRVAAAGEVPDFITQTDKYGNATTPRTEAAVVSAKQTNGDVAEDVLDVDPCETLLDSIRLMCCCLVPDDPATVSTVTTKSVAQSPPSSSPAGAPTQVTTQLTVEDKEDDSVKLLPRLHPDDKGKKCLVLDLDETLVHSSFRAVPGADFVIPVQVRILLRAIGTLSICPN